MTLKGSNKISSTPSGSAAIDANDPGVSLRSTPGYFLSALQAEGLTHHASLDWISDRAWLNASDPSALNALLAAPFPFTAGTENDFFQNTSMNTAGNYTLGLPTNVQDVLLTTNGGTSLTMPGAPTTRNMGSLNQTNNTAYTISNSTSTANNTTLNLGGGGTTDSIVGSNGSDLIFLGGATSSLTIQGPNGSTGSGVLNLVALADGNFDVGNTGATLNISSVVSGAFNLTKIGSGKLTLIAANTFGSGKTFTLSAGTVNCGAANTIPSGTSLALNGGTLQSGATTGFTQSTGTLALSDNSTIALGTGSHSITFTASNGVSWTSAKTLTITGWTGGYNGTSGTAGKIFVGSTSSGLTASQLSEIVFFNGTSNFPATILSTGEVVPFTDTTPPTISYTAFADTTSLSNRTLSMTVTDSSGVPTSGTGLPVIYFRKGTSGAYSSTQCSFVSGSNYNCIIDYGLVGGVTPGNSIQYFVAAQDSAATPNVTTNPSTAASGFTASPPSASTPTTAPNSYSITCPSSITVNDTGDGSDSTAGNGVCETASGNGVCTLRAAIQEANALTSCGGTITINFNISGGGVQTITPASVLPAITRPVIIDGTTQAGSSCTTVGGLTIELNGTNAGATGAQAGLELDSGASGSTIKGLVINRFGSYGIFANSNSNTVQCNYVGTNVAGTSGLGNHNSGIRISGNSNLVGGTAAGNGNIFAGNSSEGIRLVGTGNQVQGNYVGVNAAGTAIIANGGGGVDIQNSTNTTVGGTSTGARNVISGHAGGSFGISIQGSSSNTIVQGNYIGTDATGTTGLGNSRGVNVGTGATGNTIGGIGAGEANLIAFNSLEGVAVFAFGTTINNSVRGNSIFSNSGLGIDLNGDGVTGNDNKDPDTGPNNLQNFPVLTAPLAGATTVSGTLNSTVGATFTIDVYSNDACDGSGNGEGKTYLGSTTTSATDSNGNVSFNVTVPAVVSGKPLTATATDANGNTSEFSGCVSPFTTSTISGTVLTTGGAGTMGSGRTITLLKNGTFAGSGLTDGSGNYSISGLTLAGGDKLAVFIDNATEKGATATLSGTSDITNLNIIQNALIVRADNGGTITNAILKSAQGGSPDADLTAVYTVDGSNNLTTSVGVSLELWTGSLYTPGGNITDGGDWTNNANVSAFTPGAFAFAFDGNANQVIGGSANTTFNTLNISNTGTSPNNVVSLAITNQFVNTALNINSGVFSQGASGTDNFDITTGAATVAAGATWQNLGTGDLSLTGNVVNNGTINFNAHGTPCGGDDDIRITPFSGGPWNWSGTGTFSMIDVFVKSMTASVPILVRSGTNFGDVTAPWLFVDACTSGSYTWIGGANQSWQIPTNWNPTRTTTDPADQLTIDFSVTPSPTIQNVPTQTIATLTLVGPTFPKLEAATGGSVLTISGATGSDLNVPSTSSLMIDTANALKISITSGSTAKIGGGLQFLGGAHEIVGGAVGSILFQNNSDFSYFGTANPFGTGAAGDGVSNSVEFQSGSIGEFNDGLDPFGGPTASQCVFDSGSSASFGNPNPFAPSGRTFGNLLVDTGLVASGNQPFTVLNNLTIDLGGTLQLSSSAGGDMNLLGNFENDNGAGAFDPNNRTVKFQGGNTTQTILSTNPTESFFDVFINETAGGEVKLLSPVTINGQLNLSTVNSLLELNQKTLTMNGTVTGSGKLKGDASAAITIGGTGPLGTLNFLSGAQTLSSVTMDRSTSGSAAFGNDMSVDSLALTNGVLDLGTFTLTANGTVTRSNGYVIGKLKKKYTAQGAKTFEVGTLNGYSPVDVNVTFLNFSPLFFTVNATGTKHPNISGTNALSRYWTITPSVTSGFTADLSFQYLAGDVTGTESNYKVFKYSGGFTQPANQSIDTGAHTATVTGVTSFSDWTLAEPGSVNPPSLGNYPNTPVSVPLSGDTTVAPTGNVAPTNTTSIEVSTSTDFKGKLEGDPATGVVRVTDAHPAGTYTVTLTAFNAGTAPTSKTFTLTVTTPATCTPIAFSTNTLHPGLSGTAYSVAIGDFNRDGFQDLVIATDAAPNYVNVFLNDGSGGFSGPTNFNVGGPPHSVAVGDFNGDGNEDIVTANITGNVSILLGNGAGSFGAPTNFPALGTAISLAVGDFNGDGKQDLVVVNSNESVTTNNVAILLGNGDGSFGSPSTFTADNGPLSVVVGDFNSDGKQDLATANGNSNDVSILLGDGLGGFSAATNVSVGNQPNWIALGDFNGDGKQDLVTANPGSSNLSILIGNGLGGFSAAPDVPSTSSSYVAVGDFDGDGKQDLVVSRTSPNRLSVFLGDGLANFGAAVNFNLGNQPYPIAVGDFNRDGLQDLAAPSDGNNISLLTRECAPVITAGGPLSRQQGSPAINSQIATVSDAEQAANTLGVTATPLTGSGVSVNNISVDESGNVTADVAAACAATNSTFTLTVTDNAGAAATDTLTVNVTANTPPTLTYANGSVAAGGATSINPATGPADDVSVLTIVVNSPGTYTGTISVDNSTGVVSISNAQPGGSHTITIRATDNCTFTDATFTLDVTCPTITLDQASLPDGTQGTNYDQQLSASGGAGPYSFAVTSGSVPNGLTLETNGQLHGTPSGGGTFNFTVTATDSLGCTGSHAYTIIIASTYTITASAGANGSIDPNGAVSVSPNGAQTFNITADSGYHISDVLVDGSSVGTGSSYTFNNVTADHTISASFAANVCPVSPLVVNTKNDTHDAIPGDGACLDSGGKCSLRAAIEEANAAADSCGTIDINFDSTCFATANGPYEIFWSTPLDNIHHNVNINGPGADTLTINGGDNRVFTINSGFVVSISGLTLTEGFAPEDDPVGGALKNDGGTVTINNCLFTGNTADDDGGAIYTDGSLTLNNCTVEDNDTTNGYGGGIANHSGTLTLLNSTVSDNSADNGGGGGIQNGGHRSSNNAKLIATGSTISWNSAGRGGGGIRNLGKLTMTNTTVSGNAANNNGGGVLEGGGSSTASITNSTITNNNVAGGGCELGPCAGGGIYEDSQTIKLRNTIVAGNYNADTFVFDDVSGNVDAGSSNNLIGDGTNMTGITDADANHNHVGTSNYPIDPGLGPLANNGGPTETHQLLIGSPAIDAGDDCVMTLNACGDYNSALTTDQRGAGFARQVDGNADNTATVDIGAFEFQTFVVNTTDDHDDSVCDATDCSLREAINAANASGGGRILFNIPATDNHHFYYPEDGTAGHLTRPPSFPQTTEADDTTLVSQGLIDQDWQHSWWSIQVNNEDLGSLPELNGNVFVDGYSQQGAKVNPNPLANGDDAIIRIEIDGSRDSDGIGLEVCGYGGSTVQGLAINQFNTQQVWIVSDGNTIQGNFIGTDVSGTLGFTFGTDNCPDGIRLDDASFNDIGGGDAAQRNVISGNCDNGILLNSSGSSIEFDKANRGHANRTRPTAKPNATARTAAAARAKSAAAVKAGVTKNSSAARASGAGKAQQNSEQPFLFSSSFNNIEGNYIGTDRFAAQPLGNEIGIKDFGGSFNMIGCTVPEEANVIAGNNDDGVLLQDISASANLVQGNFIGITPNGLTELANDGAGVAIYDSVNNVIGFDSDDHGRANTIAYNTGAGVEVETGSTSAGTGNIIRSNSIYKNGGLGIDLVPEVFNLGTQATDGVTPNDGKDPDTGANNLQNFPIVTSATAGSIQDQQSRRLGTARPSDAPLLGPSINGTLNSTPGQTFRIDFYTNAECNSSPSDTPYGEGQTWMGSLLTDPTDTDGNVSFVFVPVSLHAGDIITATATDIDGNTSEFSMCFVVPSNAQSTTTTVITNASSLSTTPSAFNAPFTVKWSVTPGAATGTVTVTIDGNFGCSDAVSVGQCDITPSTSGAKTLAAHYGGDANFLSSDSSPVTHTVNPPLLSGHVDYCITPSDNVPGVTINVTGSQTTSTTTDSSGNYSINLPEGHDYTLTPTKTPLAPMAPGIDTADVVGAQRHFLGFASLNGCALTAADADEDSRIDTVDAIAIQRFFLGAGSGTGHVGEWQFNPANRPYANLSSSQSGQDYTALVVGDITGDVTPTIANRDRGNSAAHPLIPSAVNTVSLPIGNVSTNVTNFTLAVTTSNIDPADNLVGFQGDFTFDSSVVTFQATPASPAGLTASNWNVSANILGAGTIKTLRISAFSNTSTPLSGSGTLFNLNFTRVSNTVGANTPLTWAAPPNNFVFIDTNLAKQAPSNTPAGSITIIGPTAANGNISGQILDNTGTPVEGAAVRMSGTQNRLTITDAQGNYHFDEVETNGLYVLTPSRSNFTFSPVQRSFSQLGAHTEATFTGAASGNGLNPLDTTEYFVRQQYLDFLGREPDDAGLNFWVNNIDSCGADANCREAKRVDTSAAFFLSIEFQQTGYLVYRTYESAYGNLDGAPVPMKLSDFKPDTREISNGVVVLQDGWQQKLENNKRAFIAEFVQRPRFNTAYPIAMTPAQFVDQLFGNAHVPSTDPDYAAALAEFGAATDTSDAAARARVLRRVAENSLLTRQQFNQAFVLMQYFGYLERDPNSGRDVDFTGYNFWLEKLNHFNGNFENAEMVKAFLSSAEYRQRFPR